MERINFTTAVLGKKAAARLKEHQVTQTIRSGTSSIALAINNRRVKLGEIIQVALDDELVDYARLLGMDKVSWEQLTEDDAWCGGFDNRIELIVALRRAGYRFKPIDQYQLYRCKFTWVVEGRKGGN